MRLILRQVQMLFDGIDIGAQRGDRGLLVQIAGFFTSYYAIWYGHNNFIELGNHRF
jgi:hypothetical protein